MSKLVNAGALLAHIDKKSAVEHILEQKRPLHRLKVDGTALETSWNPAIS
jgi:hypothetical protein